MSPAAWALALWATAADPAAATPEAPLAPPAEAAMPETTPDEGEAPPVDRPYLEALVDRLGREGHAEGLRHLEAGELPQALKALLEAQELDPTDPGIEHDLARTYHRLGNVERAERAYRAAMQLDPKRAAVYLDLADLLMASGKRGAIEEARRVLTGARELLGNVTPVLVRQARAAAAAGDAATAERLYLDLVAPGPAAAGSDDPASDASWIELSIELGDYYRDLGRWDEALHTYRDAAATGDQVAGERVRQTAVEAEARRLGWTQRSADVDVRARRLVEQAAGLSVQGRLTEAEAALHEALQLAPGLTVAALQLGDVRRAQGDAEGAELAYLRALAVDHGSVELHARLAELYLAAAAPAAERLGAAVLLLERAVQLGPDRAELQLRLAQALRLAGDLPGALHAVDAYLGRRDTAGLGVALAQTLRANLLELLRGEPEAASAGIVPAAGEGPAGIYNRVRVLLARGETGAAMAELHSAGAAGPSAALRNLEARILRGTGRAAEAVGEFEASLAIEPDQAAVYTELGRLRAELGATARARQDLETADRLGDPEAAYHLAWLDMADYRGANLGQRAASLRRLWDTRGRLERFLATVPASIYAGEARVLQAQMRDALVAWAVGGGAAVALLLLLVMTGWRALARGETLETLCDRFPEVGPEVQRVLSAIRHEVLKHHTLPLGSVIEALERGDDVSVTARHAAEVIIGSPDDAGGVPSLAAAERLRGYTHELERLARNRGVTLVLRRDPVLAGLRRGFALLAALSRDLRRADALGPRRRRRLLRRLRAAADLLNVRGYEAVSSFVDRLGVLAVDEGLLASVFERIRREPGFAGLPIAPLRLQLGVPLPRQVCVARRDLEDILGNLLRNAIAASARGVAPGAPGRKAAGGGRGEDAGAIEVGLSAQAEVNQVTGHERLVLGVLDRATRPIDAAALRGQPGRGLHLTTELVARYDGSLQVDTTVPGWAKAVLVKLPCPEAVPA